MRKLMSMCQDRSLEGTQRIPLACPKRPHLDEPGVFFQTTDGSLSQFWAILGNFEENKNKA